VGVCINDGVALGGIRRIIGKKKGCCCCWIFWFYFLAVNWPPLTKTYTPLPHHNMSILPLKNKRVLRSFTLYGHILCYHEESKPELITDPSKPRARLNLAKTETIAEMHSKHKQGLPTDHLLTINIYDPVIRNKRKWEMCCTSKEQQLMWYNAIRVHDGPPVVVQSASSMMGGVRLATAGENNGGAWSPTHESTLQLHNIDSSNNLFSPLPAKKILQRVPSMEQEDVLLTKAAVKAVEVWMEKENMKKNVISRNTIVLLFVTLNGALYFVRNGSDQTFQATLFFINAFVLYVVLERTGVNTTSSKEINGKGLQAKLAKKKEIMEEIRADIKADIKTPLLEAIAIQKPRVKMMLGSTMPRSNPDSFQIQPHSYRQTDAPLFNLRVGPNYKRNKQKAPSGPALYDLYSMDFLYDSTALKNVSDKFKIPSVPGITDVSTGHAHIPPMLVINTWLPGEEPSVFAKTTDGDTYSIPMVFVLSKDTLEELKDIDNASPGVKLLSEWCRRAETEPEFRGRFKCMGQIEDIESTSIPKFIHGYNGKPALVTKSGTFTRHENYIEFTINVNYWAFLARKGLHSLMPYFQDFVFNVGFTIEARHDEEMPEVLLGGCRIMNLDPEKAAVVE